MSGISLNWAVLNLNGEIITKSGRSSIRCEWTQARCNLAIMAQGMETIDLHVELDITSMMYSTIGSRSQTPHLIFLVSLNRPTNWAQNDFRTWRGSIGVKLDTNPPWIPELYEEMVQSLSTLFEGQDEVAELSHEQMALAWANIGKSSETVTSLNTLQCFPELDVPSLERLSPTKWFNGELVLTGIRDWCVRELLKAHPQHPPVLVKGNYFFTHLCNHPLNPSGNSWEDDKLFNQAYIVVPLHLQERKHFALAIIIQPALALQNDDPAIIAVFDSIRCLKTYQMVGDTLQKWMICVSQRTEPHQLNIKTIHVKVPEQQNHYDCGPFVVHFAFRFFSDATEYTHQIQRDDLTDAEVTALWKPQEVGLLRSQFLKYIQASEIELI